MPPLRFIVSVALLGLTLAVVLFRLELIPAWLFDPTKPDAPPTDPIAADELRARCGIPGLEGDFGVVVVSVSEGSTPVDFLIERTGRAVTREDVVVGATVKPIVLVLMAEEPVVWSLGRTKEARILGVLAQGEYRQAVVGLPKSTPITTHEAARSAIDCMNFWAAQPRGTDYDRVRSRVRTLFGREIAAFLNEETNGTIVVGKVTGPVEHSPDTPLESVALAADVVPTGQRGLDRLQRDGAIRRARDDEVEAWIVGAAERRGMPVAAYRDRLAWRTRRGDVYTVLRPFELPGGLFGAHSRTFILPPGMALPRGPKDHSLFLQMDEFQCDGLGCR